LIQNYEGYIWFFNLNKFEPNGRLVGSFDNGNCQRHHVKKHIGNGVEPKDDLIVSNYSLELGTRDETFSKGEVFSQQLMYVVLILSKRNNLNNVLITKRA